MNKLVSYAFYYLYYISIINSASKMIPVSIIRDYGVCDGVKKGPFHMEMVTVNVTGRGATTFNGDILVDENLDPLTLLEVKVHKCASTNADSCEFYSTYKFTDPCGTIITDKEGPWAAMFNTKPPLSCPVKKGSYRLHQSSMKTKYLTLANVNWKFIAKFFIEKRLVSCFKGSIEKVTIRNKSKTRGGE